jgi:hypothetical protein
VALKRSDLAEAEKTLLTVRSGHAAAVGPADRRMSARTRQGRGRPCCPPGSGLTEIDDARKMRALSKTGGPAFVLLSSSACLLPR